MYGTLAKTGSAKKGYATRPRETHDTPRGIFGPDSQWLQGYMRGAIHVVIAGCPHRVPGVGYPIDGRHDDPGHGFSIIS